VNHPSSQRLTQPLEDSINLIQPLRTFTNLLALLKLRNQFMGTDKRTNEVSSEPLELLTQLKSWTQSLQCCSAWDQPILPRSGKAGKIDVVDKPMQD
jgi:hypothetical protein